MKRSLDRTRSNSFSCSAWREFGLEPEVLERGARTMAASFWTSSHASMLMTKERLRASHATDRARGLSEEQIEQLNVFHVHCAPRPDLTPHAEAAPCPP